MALLVCMPALNPINSHMTKTKLLVLSSLIPVNSQTLIWHLRRQNTKGKDPRFATGWGGSGVTQIPQSTEKPLRKLTLEDTRPFGCTSTDFTRTEKSEESNGTRSSNSFGSQARGSGAARGGDEVGFLHPTQFQSLEHSQTSNWTFEVPECPQRYLWCKDHKLAISTEILPKLYRAAQHAYSNSAAAKDGSFMETDLMRHSKALLILCPDMLTAWNSRKIVLSVNYDFTKLKDELQLCALILSYSPKNESTWSHRRWVIKKVSEHNQDVSELIEMESVLVKQIAEKSKMNYRAWRHRCWLIPYMTREQVLNELKKSTRWNELHVADNCCFHYRRSLLLALLDSCHVEDTEDSLDRKSEVHLLWKEELTWNEKLIRRYQGRESLWIHRRFLSQWWMKFLLSSEETECAAGTSLVDLFLVQEIYLLSDCLNAPADEFGEACVQSELAALYILWISKQVPAVKLKLEERLHSLGSLEDVLARACPERSRLWTHLIA
ncbi:hypothetical protein OsJ_03035 [Oryza sativa Japonica Group]|uniref:Uncharacterized protein n=1 Tax=Oryza sativa subsp. japonica TaxID=39947 RepID=B9EYM8_ORYSJ|nr:hypothetical protein OsJ_03035 [Oryza sativa Japonica Group]